MACSSVIRVAGLRGGGGGCASAVTRNTTSKKKRRIQGGDTARETLLKRRPLPLWRCKVQSPMNGNPLKINNLFLLTQKIIGARWRLSRRRARVAEGHQCFPVAGALMNRDVPFGDNRRQDA